MSLRRVLAIDPGTVKCGLAVVEIDVETPLFRRIVPISELLRALTDISAEFSPDFVLLGNGTARAAVGAYLAQLGMQPCIVDEYGTTLAARARYFQAFPPCGWRRLLPKGLRLPPVPIDDWAAVVIAERFLQKKLPIS